MDEKFYGVISPKNGNIRSIRENNGKLEFAGTDGVYKSINGGGR